MKRIGSILISYCSLAALTINCSSGTVDSEGSEPETLSLSQACDDGASEALQDREVGRVLRRLTLAEKAGQMLQAELGNLKKAGFSEIRRLNLGSVLSGGDSLIADNQPAGWQSLMVELQREALASSSRIPLLYGIDAVHGNAAVRGATVFPHNIGLGATRDTTLLREIGETTAREVAATGMHWNFGPCVAVARDERWGRTYESWGESPDLQRLYAAAYVRGQQAHVAQGFGVLGSAKHFLGDGGTIWGTGFPKVIMPDWEFTDIPQIDRGDTQLSLHQLKAIHGVGYEEALRAGVHSVMVSFSKVNGRLMSEHTELIRGYLKAPRWQGGLGFQGLVISDWNSIDDIPTADGLDAEAKYSEQVIRSINAGVDMLMVEGKAGASYKFALAHQTIQDAVTSGRIPLARVNDAVARILRAKLAANLFERYASDGSLTPHYAAVQARLTEEFGSARHRELAREAVQRSLVLLKNERRTLPITGRKYCRLYVAGKNADDFGSQLGGWTLGWQGSTGNAKKGPLDRTILDGLRARGEEQGMEVLFSRDATFAAPQRDCSSSLALAIIGETPYAEFLGDRDELALDAEDLAVLQKLGDVDAALAVVLVSGRPLIVTPELKHWDAFVAAWLPGSQGEGVADVLFGAARFSGTLPFTWPRAMTDLPINVGDGKTGLFPYGFGLSYRR